MNTRTFDLPIVDAKTILCIIPRYSIFEKIPYVIRNAIGLILALLVISVPFAFGHQVRLVSTFFILERYNRLCF